jgi:hypothetical protein
MLPAHCKRPAPHDGFDLAQRPLPGPPAAPLSRDSYITSAIHHAPGQQPRAPFAAPAPPPPLPSPATPAASPRTAAPTLAHLQTLADTLHTCHPDERDVFWVLLVTQLDILVQGAHLYDGHATLDTLARLQAAGVFSRAGHVQDPGLGLVGTTTAPFQAPLDAPLALRLQGVVEQLGTAVRRNASPLARLPSVQLEVLQRHLAGPASLQAKATYASLLGTLLFQQSAWFGPVGYLVHRLDIHQALDALSCAFDNGLPCSLDAWRTLQCLGDIEAHAIADERLAIQRIWDRCAPASLVRDIADEEAKMLLLAQPQPAAYMLYTPPEAPLHVRIAIRHNGALTARPLAEEITHRVGPSDAVDAVTYILLMADLSELGATPFVPSATRPPPPCTDPVPVIQVGATKGNKYKGRHRVSELTDASGQLAATMLETSHCGAYGKVRPAELTDGKKIVLKVTRTRAAWGRKATSRGHGPTKPLAPATLRKELALTGRFVPPLRFLWAHWVGTKVYAAQTRMTGSFKELLPRLPDDTAVQVCHSMGRQTSYYLRGMWGAGYVHRDVKPANVLWNAEGDIFPSDFGMAAPWRQVQNDTSGTRGYVAPELYKTNGSAEKADVWSWGVLMAWAHSNIRPFTTDVKRSDKARRRVRHYQEWRAGFIASGARLKDYHSGEPCWNMMFQDIGAKSEPLAEFLARHVLVVEPHDRATFKSVHRFMSVLQPPDSSEEALAKAAMLSAERHFDTSEKDAAITGYARARREGLLT